ncbi:SAVED domain-containing protein [Paenibacillus hamazuiensis]
MTVIQLFINSPASIAYFIGHFLTAKCQIHVYEFTGRGYEKAITL